jgi:hypothetical protein
LKYSHSSAATVFHITRDQGSHGYEVTLILSTCLILSRHILFSTAMIFSECSLDAISGTTHPNSLCSLI